MTIWSWKINWVSSNMYSSRYVHFWGFLTRHIFFGDPRGCFKIYQDDNWKKWKFLCFFWKTNIFWKQSIFGIIWSWKTNWTLHSNTYSSRYVRFWGFFNSSYDFWGPLGVFKNLPEWQRKKWTFFLLKKKHYFFEKTKYLFDYLELKDELNIA